MDDISLTVNGTTDKLIDTLQHLSDGGGSTFIGLADTPADFSGQGGKHLRLNTAEDALEFVEPASGGGSSTLTDLTDTPANYKGQSGKLIAVKSTEDGTEFVDASSGSGSSTFSGLTDTPANYSGQGGKYVAVTASADGIEFVSAPTGNGSGDMQASTYDPNTVAGDTFAMSNMAEGADAKVMTAAERKKLAAVEAGATADQTGAEIKAAYEAQSNTNAFTDAEKKKLSGLESLDVLVAPDANNGFTSPPPNWTGTQAEYDALKPVAGRLYFVVG